MHPNVFPLKEQKQTSIDSVSSKRPLVASSFVGRTSLREYRSEVISRGRRFRVASFSGDSILYPAHAIDVLGEKPMFFAPIRTVDALRKPGFSGVTEYRRPFVITLPNIPELPDFSGVEAAWRLLENRSRDFGDNLATGMSGFRLGISSGQAAYVPLVGAMALGMVSALLLQHSFGNGAQAEEANIVYVQQPAQQPLVDSGTSVFDTEQLLAELAAEDPDTKEFETRVRKMVAGYPIEDMVPEIVKQDRTVAMFLVAIAKKESNWGVRVPVLDGQDCYNYWGYRGIRKLMGTGGHTCFNSREDAVSTVGKRLETLIVNNHIDTPQELIIWKCGSSCAAHSSYSVQKWISDVELYYDKLNDSAPTEE
ncbi:MAG: hypothetical protein HGA31_00625 [Candidatus Moranbacteria bacterium]|nr:hypothetical protein [Candidatus Moranbacteria bacterium]